MIQDRIVERRRHRSTRQLFPPSYVSDSESNDSESPDTKSIASEMNSEPQSYPEYELPSSPFAPQDDRPDIQNKVNSEKDDLEESLDPDIVPMDSDDEELKDKILQTSNREEAGAVEDAVCMSTPKIESEKRLCIRETFTEEETAHESEADESTEASTKYSPRRKSGRRSRRSYSRRQKSGRGSARRKQKCDDRSEATGTTRSTLAGLSFIKSLDISSLDRFTDELNCSFFSARDQTYAHEDSDSDDGIEDEDFDDREVDSIISSDDESSMDSRQRRKLRLEEEVEGALEWADEHLVFCNTRC